MKNLSLSRDLIFSTFMSLFQCPLPFREGLAFARKTAEEKKYTKIKSRFETMFYQWTRNKWIHTRVYVLKSWITLLFECTLQRFSISTQLFFFHFFQRPYWKLTHCPFYFFQPPLFFSSFISQFFSVCLLLSYNGDHTWERYLFVSQSHIHKKCQSTEWFVSFYVVDFFLQH